MLKEFVEKIASLATPVTFEVGDDTYARLDLRRVEPHIDRPKSTGFSSLDGVVKAIRTEIERVTRPIFVVVDGPNDVKVMTTYREDNLQRDLLYTAAPELPSLPTEHWMDFDAAMVALRSRFVSDEEVEYVIGLLSSISDENSVKSTDNGLTQTVQVKQGLSLQQRATVRPIVTLRPYRTFLEVEQPNSEFLLRLKRGYPEKGCEAAVALFEADGGAWKLAARHNIAAYFEDKLKDLVESGKVVVAQ